MGRKVLALRGVGLPRRAPNVSCMTSQHRMPALFFGHGSPMNALERNRYTDAWRAVTASMPAPRAVLVISAHWYVRGTRVTAQARPTTIHDFGNFPRALHAFDYPAPGDPALAARVRDLLAPTDVALDEAWGLDHGTWSVLTHLFERADVPVVQLSLDGRIGLADHFAIASRLEPLRDEGVLIVGTGNVVHNLHTMRYGDGMPAYDWATRFEERVTAAAVAGDGEVEGEAGWDLDGVCAACEQRWREAAAFGPEHVGGGERMPEARQFDCVVQQFHADQGAFPRQGELFDGSVAPERHVAGRVGGVGLAAGARVPSGGDGEAEGSREGVCGSQERAHVG